MPLQISNAGDNQIAGIGLSVPVESALSRRAACILLHLLQSLEMYILGVVSFPICTNMPTPSTCPLYKSTRGYPRALASNFPIR